MVELELPFPAHLIMENPLVVFADSLVAGIDPANADPRLDPSIFTLPAVGVAPAPAELSAVGVPPAFQDHVANVTVSVFKSEVPDPDVLKQVNPSESRTFHSLVVASSDA